jgi:guanylate kinase
MSAKRKKGIMIIISAPSGAGKSTLIKRLFKRMKNLRFSISCTTRPPRPGERDGREYFFITKEEFRKKIRRGEFAEWAKVHTSYYGTPKSCVKEVMDSGKDILLDIDVQGALNLHRTYPEAPMIFIAPPSFAELERRIRHRNKDSEASIRVRLKNARHEMEYAGRYDHYVVNDSIPAAVRELEAIIKSEHVKEA